ncbi:ribonuclease H-like protein [Xylariaceae sp. AK1471]|nr:ribonuclease H-like protein [Xylariaceae sp. AK1471]
MFADYPVDEYGEEIHRLFDPDLSRMHRRVPESQLITYNTAKQVSQLQIRHPRTNAIELDVHTLVIGIDGACRDNGKPTASASWGVFVGPGSRHNASGRLEAHLPQTSSRAEIEALSHALDTVRNIAASDYSLMHVKVVSDSEYLVNAMSKWIEGWIENGGVRSRRRPIAHFEKLKAIHERLSEMEYGDDGGIVVQFWHMPREKNQEADALANRALDA